MPEIDLSAQIPVSANWLKIRYQMAPKSPNAQLIARVWSGNMEDQVVIKGAVGEALVKLGKPQTLAYQRPVNVELKLKVVAYNTDTTN